MKQLTQMVTCKHSFWKRTKYKIKKLANKTFFLKKKIQEMSFKRGYIQNKRQAVYRKLKILYHKEEHPYATDQMEFIARELLIALL